MVLDLQGITVRETCSLKTPSEELKSGDSVIEGKEPSILESEGLTVLT